jgi:tRNA(fMet)-specific endonuclease VapC
VNGAAVSPAEAPRRAARGILDTSTVILLPRIDDPDVLPNEPLITSVTLAELSVGPLVTDDDAASLHRSGRKTAARAYDAMIAATAVAHELPVYTCNPGDFRGIDGLEVVPVAV